MNNNPTRAPKLILGAPADEFDNFDDFIPASSTSRPGEPQPESSKAQRKLNEGGIGWDAYNSDEDDLEEFLLGAPETQVLTSQNENQCD